MRSPDGWMADRNSRDARRSITPVLATQRFTARVDIVPRRPVVFRVRHLKDIAATTTTKKKEEASAERAAVGAVAVPTRGVCRRLSVPR